MTYKKIIAARVTQRAKMRILIISTISFISFFPLFVMFHGLINENMAAALAVVLAWIGLPFFALKQWRAKPSLDAIYVDASDPLMQTQIGIARQQLERFLAELEQGNQEAFIKFPYEFDGEFEHVWGIAHAHRDNCIITSIISAPVHEDTQVPLNQRIKIPLKEVEDWMLTNNQGKTQGGYTMLAHAQIYERDYGKLPRRYARQLADFVDFQWKK